MVRDIKKAFYESDNALPFYFNKFGNFSISEICKHIFFVEKHNGDGINMLFGLEMGAGSSYFLPSQSQAQELVIESYGES